MNTQQNAKHTTLGIMSILLGAPYLIWSLFILFIAQKSMGKHILFLPLGLFLSLMGYGVLRGNRLLQWIVFGISLLLSISGGIAYLVSSSLDDTFANLAIITAICGVILVVGRKEKISSNQVMDLTR